MNHKMSETTLLFDVDHQKSLVGDLSGLAADRSSGHHPHQKLERNPQLAAPVTPSGSTCTFSINREYTRLVYM